MEDKWPSVYAKDKFPQKFPKVFNTKTRRRSETSDYVDDFIRSHSVRKSERDDDSFLTEDGRKILADKNLTLSDKINFLNAFEVNPQFDLEYKRLTQMNEPKIQVVDIPPPPDPLSVILKGSKLNCSPLYSNSNKRIKRSYYDDLTYIDDYDQEESKINGNWHRFTEDNNVNLLTDNSNQNLDVKDKMSANDQSSETGHQAKSSVQSKHSSSKASKLAVAMIKDDKKKRGGERETHEVW